MSIVKSTGRTLCLPRAQHAAAMLFLACALTVPARASVPTMEEAALVARNWLALSSAQGAKGYTAESKISGDWTITQDATVLAYVFAIEPAGFVVVPGLKELAAVRACSGEFNLDRSGRDDFTRMVTADLKAQMGAFRHEERVGQCHCRRRIRACPPILERVGHAGDLARASARDRP
jgi:hypothetical protein